MLISEQNPERSVARDDHSSTAAGQIIFSNDFLCKLQHGQSEESNFSFKKEDS
jgi:hypothetical protein